MRPFEDFINESDAPTNSTAGVAQPDAQPFVKKKFAGYDCVEVDSDTYVNCTQGKRPYARWSGYVGDEGLRNFVRKNYHNTKKLLVQDKSSGAMAFIK